MEATQKTFPTLLTNEFYFRLRMAWLYVVQVNVQVTKLIGHLTFAVFLQEDVLWLVANSWLMLDMVLEIHVMNYFFIWNFFKFPVHGLGDICSESNFQSKWINYYTWPPGLQIQTLNMHSVMVGFSLLSAPIHGPTLQSWILLEFQSLNSSRIQDCSFRIYKKLQHTRVCYSQLQHTQECRSFLSLLHRFLFYRAWAERFPYSLTIML